MKLLPLLLALLLCLCSCAMPSDAYYQQAQLYLGSDDYTTAADMFTQLGEYADSADYALYCQGLAALERGELSLAQADMALVSPFKSSQRYLQYIAARQLEASGQLTKALNAFVALGSFEDSQARAEALGEEIPRQQQSHALGLMRAARWEQAAALLKELNTDSSRSLPEECYRQMQQAAYDQAVRLYNSGSYAQAMAAFEALGDTLDAAARARMCRSAMYARLEEAYASACMTNARELMDSYAEMEDYLASPLRLQALQERFAVNLLLARSPKPYVRFAGQTWQVQQVSGSHALLTLVPARPETAIERVPALSPMEEDAVITQEPSRLTLDLDRYAFTQGSGTADDPYE